MENFVLVRWSGAKTLCIVSQQKAKITDANLKIGLDVAVTHKDLKNRVRAFEARILGFGTFEEMKKLQSSTFVDYNDDNDPIRPKTNDEINADSCKKRVRKANSFIYTDDFVQIDKNKQFQDGCLDSTEKYRTRSASKKSKDDKKAEKAAIENVKKTLFDNIEAVEPLHSALSTAMNVFQNNNCQTFPPMMQRYGYGPNTNVFESIDQSMRPNQMTQNYGDRPNINMFRTSQELNCEGAVFDKNYGYGYWQKNCKPVEHSLSTLQGVSEKSMKKRPVRLPDHEQEDEQEFHKQDEEEFDKQDEEEFDKQDEEEFDKRDEQQFDEQDEQDQSLREKPYVVPSNNDEQLHDSNNVSTMSSQDTFRDAEELRLALPLVYEVLAKASNKSQLCDGLINAIKKIQGSEINLPPISNTAVFNSEKVKLVELVHGSGCMVSKTAKDMALRESGGDQFALVGAALRMIYRDSLGQMSALGTRKNKRIDEDVYKVIYLFATHNKHPNAKDLTKTEYNKAINDQCTMARRPKSSKSKKKLPKNTPDEEITEKKSPKPKTKAQINRQAKMKALRQQRKKEKEDREKAST